MLYWLVDLSDKLSVLNVFRYITFRTGGAVITALLFVFLFGQNIIDRLRLLQGKGQPIRADGPKSHIIAKAGTPTMGGLMILSGMLVSTLLWASPTKPYVWVVLWVTLGFGLVGFYDDYLKVTKQSHDGFGGRTRLIIEACIAGLACVALVRLGHAPFSTSLVFPFFKELVLNLGWFFVLFAMFIIVGAGNAVNLTDGLDGLAIVPVMIAAASFGMVSYLSGNTVFADYLQIHYVAGTGELSVLCGAVLGAAQHRKLSGAGDIVNLQVVGEDRIAAEVGDHPEARGGDHHRHDGKPVEAVGQIYRVAAADDDEHREQHEDPAEIEHQFLEERKYQ